MVLFATPWFWHDNTKTTTANDADFVVAHLRHTFDERFGKVVSSDRHQIRPWFSGRLDFVPSVLNIAEKEFPLLAGRIDYVHARNVAALTYGRRKHKISLFILPRDNRFPKAGNSYKHRGLNVNRWQFGPFAYVAVSGVNANELSQFANRFKSSLARKK